MGIHERAPSPRCGASALPPSRGPPDRLQNHESGRIAAPASVASTWPNESGLPIPNTLAVHVGSRLRCKWDICTYPPGRSS